MLTSLQSEQQVGETVEQTNMNTKQNKFFPLKNQYIKKFHVYQQFFHNLISKISWRLHLCE